ncbi:hypothetical protein BFP72_08830 [Reichenbachiella sp. 5M10]|uniref:hypothetical protein n=1 Tax=Reichenbachiella sp. 5M10 TaxID=1889772 RepID=UPI000C147C16|nr:hypothetical protein [Reichenbachiella sp. 5M10]PIB35488.1 hypothetical protein BFP72_08830 [Reichenbachiella sp. 5M10]
MPKEKIAIISLLKPVDDIRSYQKIARSIGVKYPGEIHLIGYPSQTSHETEAPYRFHPHPYFGRLSFGRLLVPIRVLWQLCRLKPKLIIVNSPELLLTTVLIKLCFGSKIWYDIQENYFYNLWHQQVYPPIIRHALAVLVRSKERLLAPFFDHYLLAEKCYKQELSYLRDRYTILENKTLPSAVVHKRPRKSDAPIRLLFSGTVTANTGILQALRIAQSIADSESIELHIVGHCSEEALYKELQQHEAPWLQLNISKTPLPYYEIEHAIAQADVGIISYSINPSNARCMPTKVYEYCARKLPILYESGCHWEAFIHDNGLGLGVDFNSPDPNAIRAFLHTAVTSTPPNQGAQKALWHTEELKLMKLFEKEINNKSTKQNARHTGAYSSDR